MNHPPEIKDINPVLLTNLVRQALANPGAEVTHWEHSPLSYIKTEASNLGLHRFQGIARIQDIAYPWSIVLKAVHAPFNDSDPTFWNYHRREMLAYKDGLLAELPGGLRAPRCLGITEHPDGTCWLWLEDVQEAATDAKWTLADYSTAARCLGQFNGAYLTGHPIPQRPWLSWNWIRGWLKHYEAGCRNTLELVGNADFWNHPLLRSAFPRPVSDDIHKLWSNHEGLLTALTQLPQTFCHMDAYRPNLFLRHNAQGSDKLLAIDWVFAGPGGLGEEIANLLAASLIWFEYDVQDAKNLDQAIFNNYVEGLREADWNGDVRLARLGYAAACSLRWGLVGLWWLDALNDVSKQAAFEQHWNHSMPELVKQWSSTFYYVLGLAEEAYGFQSTLF
jgi:hypothetical protein